MKKKQREGETYPHVHVCMSTVHVHRTRSRSTLHTKQVTCLQSSVLVAWSNTEYQGCSGALHDPAREAAWSEGLSEAGDRRAMAQDVQTCVGRMR